MKSVMQGEVTAGKVSVFQKELHYLVRSEAIQIKTSLCMREIPQHVQSIPTTLCNHKQSETLDEYTHQINRLSSHRRIIASVMKLVCDFNKATCLDSTITSHCHSYSYSDTWSQSYPVLFLGRAQFLHTNRPTTCSGSCIRIVLNLVSVYEYYLIWFLYTNST